MCGHSRDPPPWENTLGTIPTPNSLVINNNVHPRSWGDTDDGIFFLCCDLGELHLTQLVGSY